MPDTLLHPMMGGKESVQARSLISQQAEKPPVIGEQVSARRAPQQHRTSHWCPQHRPRANARFSLAGELDWQAAATTARPTLAPCPRLRWRLHPTRSRVRLHCVASATFRFSSTPVRYRRGHVATLHGHPHTAAACQARGTSPSCTRIQYI